MKSLEGPLTAITEQALTGITLYIRESPEDGGVLILSREPLEEVLLQIGCQRIDLTEVVWQWRLPE
jgi:hypothetical protein